MVEQSAGRGKKQCPRCSKYVGVRTSSCECGYEFSPKKAKVVQHYLLPGIGRKQCACGIYVGVRTHVCSKCGHKFERRVYNKKVELEPEEKDTEALNWVKTLTGQDGSPANLIFSPTGECPIALSNCDVVTVYEWCNALFVHGCQNNKLYAPQAYRCYARLFYPVSSDEYKYVICYINDWVDDKMDSCVEH